MGNLTHSRIRRLDAVTKPDTVSPAGARRRCFARSWSTVTAAILAMSAMSAFAAPTVTGLFAGKVSSGTIEALFCSGGVDVSSQPVSTGAINVVTFDNGTIHISITGIATSGGPVDVSVLGTLSGTAISVISFAATGAPTGSGTSGTPGPGSAGSFDAANGTLTLNLSDEFCDPFTLSVTGSLQKQGAGAGPISPDSPSVVLTQIENLNSFARTTVQLIGTAARNRLRLEGNGPAAGVAPVAGGLMLQGQAAGDGLAYPVGVWASYQSSSFEDEFAATALDADSDTVFIGADVSPWPNTVFGVALGYESTDTSTLFNAGGQDSESFSVVPYAGILFSENVGVDFDLSVDFSVGYSRVDIDQFRVVPGTTTRVTSDTDAERWFVSANLTAGDSFGNLYLSGRVGVLAAWDETEGFTESDGTSVSDLRAELGQVRVGVDAAYLWGSFEPFVSATYELDYDREDILVASGAPHPNDDDGVLVSAGLRWYSSQAISASFEYNTMLGREDVDSDTYSFRLRAEF